MNFWELLLIGAGLAMDAFAVSVCKGLAMKRPRLKFAALIALFFGFFQAVMPLLGWVLGRGFERYITEFDHWISFGLLAFIGGKMIAEAFGKESPEEEKTCILDLKELFILSVATSIDALAVGITFAFLSVNITYAVSVIGTVTFIISFAGVIIGSLFGAKYKNKAELLGGIILVSIGVKILLEHLGVIAF